MEQEGAYIYMLCATGQSLLNVLSNISEKYFSMLTYKKPKLYKKYDGDGDAWVSRSWWWERNKMTSDEWAVIGQLISELKLINNGLAAASFAEIVETKIREYCDDDQTIAKLKELSRTMT